MVSRCTGRIPEPRHTRGLGQPDRCQYARAGYTRAFHTLTRMACRDPQYDDGEQWLHDSIRLPKSVKQSISPSRRILVPRPLCDPDRPLPCRRAWSVILGRRQVPATCSSRDIIYALVSLAQLRGRDLWL